MDGFKDSTKTRYLSGPSATGVRGAAGLSSTMSAFRGGKPVEGTSSRPVNAQGKQATRGDLERSNRDVGGLNAVAARAAGAAVARGNRVQAEEAAESRLARPYTPKPRGYCSGGAVKKR